MRGSKRQKRSFLFSLEYVPALRHLNEPVFLGLVITVTDRKKQLCTLNLDVFVIVVAWDAEVKVPSPLRVRLPACGHDSSGELDGGRRNNGASQHLIPRGTERDGRDDLI